MTDFWEVIARHIILESSLTSYDYICICAEYANAINGGMSDAELRKRKYTEATIAEVRRNAPPTKILNLKFVRHPSFFKYEGLGYVLTLFENYGRGLLPFAGPITDQPAQIMELFALITALRKEIQLKQEAKNNVGRSKSQHRVSR